MKVRSHTIPNKFPTSAEQSAAIIDALVLSSITEGFLKEQKALERSDAGARRILRITILPGESPFFFMK